MPQLTRTFARPYGCLDGSRAGISRQPRGKWRGRNPPAGPGWRQARVPKCLWNTLRGIRAKDEKRVRIGQACQATRAPGEMGPGAQRRSPAHAPIIIAPCHVFRGGQIDLVRHVRLAIGWQHDIGPSRVFAASGLSASIFWGGGRP